MQALKQVKKDPKKAAANDKSAKVESRVRKN